jgi:hypothetical protein
MPAQQSCRLDEEASETMAGKQPRQPGQHRPIRRFERRALRLATEDRRFVTEYDDFDREIGVAATDESDQLQYAAQRSVEEREGHHWMLSASKSNRQSPAHRWWTTFSAPTSHDAGL